MGGRGGSSSISRARGQKRGLSFGRKGKQIQRSLSLLPAKLNRLTNTGDLKKMLAGFGKSHAGSSREYGATIDSNGYATGYYEGSTGSVSFPDGSTNGRHVIHNHPSGGWANFSGQDLVMMARSKSTGISAISQNVKTRSKNPKVQKAYRNRRAGTYTITKTHRFKAEDFEKEIRNMKVHDTNYDLDLHKWLKANQRKYGYKYSYTKAKNKV